MACRVLATNVVTGLGRTTAACLEQLRQGKTCVRLNRAASIGVAEDFMASRVDINLIPGLSALESLAVESINEALSHCRVDVASPRTLFILSSTKGNIENVTHEGINTPNPYVGESARAIANHIGITTTPITVSNACISGLAALTLAKRVLETGEYDAVIVTGADLIGKFIVSGFQSFMALSSERCKPFDADRRGLNLGEGAATIVLSNDENAAGWYVEAAAVRNDANHISGPSRTGEGAYRALRAVTSNLDVVQPALISAHGTATPYNDEMESIAIDRAGLSSIPVNALKGYLGHTLGAAGVVESALLMAAFDAGFIPPTLGFTKSGTSRPLNIVTTEQKPRSMSFVKMLSGFGGTNAAVRFNKRII